MRGTAPEAAALARGQAGHAAHGRALRRAAALRRWALALAALGLALLALGLAR